MKKVQKEIDKNIPCHYDENIKTVSAYGLAGSRLNI